MPAERGWDVHRRCNDIIGTGCDSRGDLERRKCRLLPWAITWERAWTDHIDQATSLIPCIHIWGTSPRVCATVTVGNKKVPCLNHAAVSQNSAWQKKKKNLKNKSRTSAGQNWLALNCFNHQFVSCWEAGGESLGASNKCWHLLNNPWGCRGWVGKWWTYIVFDKKKKTWWHLPSVWTQI